MGCKCLEVVGALAEPIPAETTPILRNHSIASSLPTRVCKPLSIVMSLRDLPMTSMNFENGRHETLPSSYQEILASLRNRFGRPLYPRRRLRTNCPRRDLDEAGLQARHIAVR